MGRKSGFFSTAQLNMLAVLCVLALSATACSGGGSGSSSGGTVTTTSTEVNDPPANDDPVQQDPGDGGNGQQPTDPVVTPAIQPTNDEINRSTGRRQINAQAAYTAGAGGQNVTVAVIDTGVDVNHSDLAGRIAPASTDIVTNNAANVGDEDGHGTHIAGIIAANANGQGTVGVAPRASILAIRADDRDPSCGRPLNCGFRDSDNAAAINYAIDQGAQIINLSQGKDSALSQAYTNALNRAANNGVLVVAAAGNEEAPHRSIRPVGPARALPRV